MFAQHSQLQDDQLQRPNVQGSKEEHGQILPTTQGYQTTALPGSRDSDWHKHDAVHNHAPAKSRASAWSIPSSSLNSPFPSNQSSITNVSSDQPQQDYARSSCSSTSFSGNRGSTGYSSHPGSSSPAYMTSTLPEWVHATRNARYTPREGDSDSDDEDTNEETMRAELPTHSRSSSYNRAGPGRLLSRNSTVKANNNSNIKEAVHAHSRSYSQVNASAEQSASYSWRTRSASDSTGLLPSHLHSQSQANPSLSSSIESINVVEPGECHQHFHQHTASVPWLDGLIQAREKGASMSEEDNVIEPSALQAQTTAASASNLGLGLTLRAESHTTSQSHRPPSRIDSPGLVISQPSDGSQPERMTLRDVADDSSNEGNAAQAPKLAAPAPLRQGDLEMLQALHIGGWDDGEDRGASDFWSSPSAPRRRSLTVAMRQTSADLAAGAAKAAAAVSKSSRLMSVLPRRKTSKDVDSDAGPSSPRRATDVGQSSSPSRQRSATASFSPSRAAVRRQQSTDSIELNLGTTSGVTIHSSMSALPSLSPPAPGVDATLLPGLSTSPVPLVSTPLSTHANLTSTSPAPQPQLRPRGYSHSHLFKMHLGSPTPSIPEESIPVALPEAGSNAAGPSRFTRRQRSTSTLRSVRTNSRDSLRSTAIAQAHSRSQSQATAASLASSSTSSLSRKSMSISSLREESTPEQEEENDVTITVNAERDESTAGETTISGATGTSAAPPDHPDEAPLSSFVGATPVPEGADSTSIPAVTPITSATAADSRARLDTTATASVPESEKSHPRALPSTLSTSKRKDAPPPLALSFSHRATSAYRSFAKKSSTALSNAWYGVNQPLTPSKSAGSTRSRPTSPIKSLKDASAAQDSRSQSPVKKILASSKTPPAMPPMQIAAMNDSSGGAAQGDVSGAFSGGGGGGNAWGPSGTPSGAGGGGGGQRRPNGNHNGAGGGAGGAGGNGGGGGGSLKGAPSSSESVSTLFKRLELVGRGAYGAVYRGVHQPTGNIVALKVVNLDTPDDDVSDIQREVALLSQLREAEQKNVVRYWGCWLKGPELWIVMDFAEGGSVRTLMRAGSIAEQHAVIIVRETLVALAYLHKAGIIHRDIKAANILLTNQGKILLCDFGVAASLVSSVAKRTTFVGTPYWMAPEVITTGKTYDQSADIWSLGITIYEIVTGNPPLADQEQMRAIMMIPKNKPPRLPSDGNFSSHMRDFVATCLNEEAKERPGAEELSKSKWIKGSAKVSSAILKDLIAAYTAWTKSGGMRMSLLGAEAADFDAGNRDSFAYDNADTLDGWEFGTVGNGAELARHMNGSYESASYEGFDGRQASGMTPSSSQQQQPRDHPLLRLFRPEGMEMEEAPVTAVPSQQVVQAAQAPQAPQPLPPAASSGMLAHFSQQEVRPAPPPPGLGQPEQVEESTPAAPSQGHQTQAPAPVAPPLVEKPSFTGTGASPFRFGAPVGKPVTPKTPELPSAPPQMSPSKRWGVDHSRAQRPSESSSGGSARQGGTVDDPFGGSTSVTERSSESPVSSGHGRGGASRQAPHHHRGQSSASTGSVYSRNNTATSAEQSPVMTQNAYLPSENMTAPSRPWTSGDSNGGRPRNDSFGSQTSWSAGERSGTTTADGPVGVFQPTQPSLLGPRNRSGSRSRAGPGGDLGLPPMPPVPGSVVRPTPRDQLSRLQMPVSGHGENVSAVSPSSAGVRNRNNSQGSTNMHAPAARPSPLDHLITHQRRQHGGSDPTMGGEPATVFPSRMDATQNAPQHAYHVPQTTSGPPIRPLDLSNLTTKDAVHDELARTVQDLGAWLDTLALSL